MEYHSQCGEDRWIEENLKPSVGTFCEVGAFDGVMSSNTYHFEKLGWTGILVEADPYLAAKCHDNRKAMTWCCASGNPWYGLFHINFSDRGLSGMKAAGTPIYVPVFPLHLLLSASGMGELDLLSIDTEGTELTVWNTIGDYRPKIVIMEYQTCDQPSNDKAIIERMEVDGYKEVHRTQYNLIFTR